MKLIVISGATNSKKNLLAHRLASSLKCDWIKPYSNQKIPINSNPVDWFISLNDKQLNDKLGRELPLAETFVEGNRYVFFQNQLNGDYSIITGDDSIVFNVMNNWDGEVATVVCHSNSEEPSVRCLMSDSEFDYVYHYEDDDFEVFKEQIL